jgi:serine/threonine protein kinase
MQQGSRIGDWVVVRRIGRGAMGQVWLCRHGLVSERLAALKVLGGACDPDRGYRRFAREVATLEKLRHESIVGCRGCGVIPSSGEYWVAMEYVEGPTLSVVLDGGPMPAGEVVALAARLAAGLRHAHGVGVVHRDIKPANIVMGVYGPVLVDFGIALASGQDRLTAVGATLGTLAYMPPEIFLDEAEPDLAAADFYALGVVLYEALVGRRAFPTQRGLSDQVAQVQVLKAKVTSGALDPGQAVVPALRRLVLLLTAPDPKARPRRWEEVEALVGQASEELAAEPRASWRPSRIVPPDRVATQPAEGGGPVTPAVLTSDDLPVPRRRRSVEEVRCMPRPTPAARATRASVDARVFAVVAGALVGLLLAAGMVSMIGTTDLQRHALTVFGARDPAIAR